MAWPPPVDVASPGSSPDGDHRLGWASVTPCRISRGCGSAPGRCRPAGAPICARPPPARRPAPAAAASASAPPSGTSTCSRSIPASALAGSSPAVCRQSDSSTTSRSSATAPASCGRRRPQRGGQVGGAVPAQPDQLATAAPPAAGAPRGPAAPARPAPNASTEGSSGRPHRARSATHHPGRGHRGQRDRQPLHRAGDVHHQADRPAVRRPGAGDEVVDARAGGRAPGSQASRVRSRSRSPSSLRDGAEPAGAARPGRPDPAEPQEHPPGQPAGRRPQLRVGGHGQVGEQRGSGVRVLLRRAPSNASVVELAQLGRDLLEARVLRGQLLAALGARRRCSRPGRERGWKPAGGSGRPSAFPSAVREVSSAVSGSVAVVGPEPVQQLVDHRLRGAVDAVGDPDPARQRGVARRRGRSPRAGIGLAAQLGQPGEHQRPGRSRRAPTSPSARRGARGWPGSARRPARPQRPSSPLTDAVIARSAGSSW